VRVWINGSFVTAKDEPGDFDCVWSPVGVDRMLLEEIGPELLDLSHQRAAQKARFGGEFLPNVVEAASGETFAAFFQTDRDGTPKGIVAIDPSKESWT
jgi:hypothetical protein